MFKRHACGHTAAKSEFVSEATFSRDTTENIRRVVHDSKRPTRTEPLNVFATA